MIIKIRISEVYPLREGNRKSDGAPYAAREIKVYEHRMDGSYPDYLLVNLSGDMARNADSWDLNQIYEADLSLNIDERMGKDGQIWRKQNIRARSIMPEEIAGF